MSYPVTVSTSLAGLLQFIPRDQSFQPSWGVHRRHATLVCIWGSRVESHLEAWIYLISAGRNGAMINFPALFWCTGKHKSGRFKKPWALYHPPSSDSASQSLEGIAWGNYLRDTTKKPSLLDSVVADLASCWSCVGVVFLFVPLIRCAFRGRTSVLFQ